LARSLTVLKKSGSQDEFHELGYECLPNGQYRLADVFHTSDEYPVTVFEQTFNNERDADDALERRLEDLSRLGFVLKIPRFFTASS
jgi:hypothetical protein